MDPITLALMGLQIGGGLAGILGKNKRKSIDPAWLQQHFGAGAVNTELQDLFNRAITSAQGQQLLGSAAESGQQFQTDIARQSAAAGLGPAGGATGGADIFASAGAGQAANNLQRSMRASLMQSMLPVAQNLVQSRLQAYMQGEGIRAQQPYEDSPIASIGNMAEDWATKALAKYGKKPGTDTTGTTATPAAPAIPTRLPTEVPGQITTQPAPMASLAPSMRDVQGTDLRRGLGPSRFISKMGRFNGSMGSAVQYA